MNRISSEDILIRVQETPNPNALKFIVNLPLKKDGKATYRATDDYSQLPLIASLFFVEGLEQVYVYQNTLTVHHTGLLPAADLVGQVKSILRTRLPIHDPHFLGPDEVEVSNLTSASEPPQRASRFPEIDAILDRTIRPGLQSDGGDVDIVDFDGTEVKILYQGACGGCPSSMYGTLDAIQNILRQELGKPDLQVRPV